MFTFAILILIPALTLATLTDQVTLIARLRSAIDSNKDGRIYVHEYISYYMKLDTDQNNEISLAEFTAGLISLDARFNVYASSGYAYIKYRAVGGITRVELRNAFNRADVKANGYIGQNELFVTFQALLSHH